MNRETNREINRGYRRVGKPLSRRILRQLGERYRPSPSGRFLPTDLLGEKEVFVGNPRIDERTKTILFPVAGSPTELHWYGFREIHPDLFSFVFRNVIRPLWKQGGPRLNRWMFSLHRSFSLRFGMERWEPDPRAPDLAGNFASVLKRMRFRDNPDADPGDHDSPLEVLDAIGGLPRREPDPRWWAGFVASVRSSRGGAQGDYERQHSSRVGPGTWRGD